jgi:leucyl-tRNA synthetase
MTLAPEHELVDEITTEEFREAVAAYKLQASKRSERDRMADTKTITGQFTGGYAINPFTKQEIPIWIGDYVLAGYGTGAVMAVPGHDSRDYAFAKHFGLPIVEVVKGGDITKESYDAKEGTLVNSGFLNGLEVKDAMKAIIAKIEEMGIGKGLINYRLRDAIFGRQRYWGEPIPVYYENDIPKLLPDSALPLNLPEVDKYLPTEDGEPPLARAENFRFEGHEIETTTMPGWAGSSWYFLRYMDPHNETEFVSKEAIDYWQNVDLYVGGSEHATGHLLYARFWHKFFADRGWVTTQEPFKKLVNQGMIQGMSAFVHRIKNTNTFVSRGLISQHETTPIHVDVNILDGDLLNLDEFKASRAEYANAEFILEDGKYLCSREVEKMSKSKYNVVNPDDIVEKYGADVLRMYEMFLGPIEQSKPWNTQGLSGVSNFLRKFWRLFHASDAVSISDEAPNEKELKALHTCIKKVNEDIEAFSFNTSVSAFMICTNELTELGCNTRAILEPLTVLLAPFAPHIAEELWAKLGHAPSVTQAPYPVFEAKYLTESTKDYPVSFNGKVRFNITLPADMAKDDVEKAALADERTEKYLEGKSIRKIIVVPGRIVNVVLG